jgi:hypothetical protein
VRTALRWVQLHERPAVDRHSNSSSSRVRWARINIYFLRKHAQQACCWCSSRPICAEKPVSPALHSAKGITPGITCVLYAWPWWPASTPHHAPPAVEHRQTRQRCWWFKVQATAVMQSVQEFTTYRPLELTTPSLVPALLLLLVQAKAVMQELHAICAENSWSTCCQAAQVLQQQLLGVESVRLVAGGRCSSCSSALARVSYDSALGAPACLAGTTAAVPCGYCLQLPSCKPPHTQLYLALHVWTVHLLLLPCFHSLVARTCRLILNSTAVLAVVLNLLQYRRTDWQPRHMYPSRRLWPWRRLAAAASVHVWGALVGMRLPAAGQAALVPHRAA